MKLKTTATLQYPAFLTGHTLSDTYEGIKNSNYGHFLSSTVLLADLSNTFQKSLFILATACRSTPPFLYKPMTQKSTFFLVIAL